MSDQDVKRWTFYNCNNETDAGDDMAGLGVVDDGEWVLATDYDTMKTRLEGEIRTLKPESISGYAWEVLIEESLGRGQTIAQQAAEIAKLRKQLKKTRDGLEAHTPVMYDSVIADIDAALATDDTVPA